VAQEFVANYLTAVELVVALYEAEPRPPALTAALAQVQSDDPDLAKFIAAAENGVPMPSIPEMAAIWGPFGTAEAAIIGGAEVDEALDAAAEAITDQIG
jgi:arabinogalactan oligomer/maltooligosaccharide transport system substrate-binding protein